MPPTVYLRPDVIAEPLVNRWYATSYLLSPMTAPLMVANGQLPMLRSFATAPMVHVHALRNPEMAGGAYIAHPPERADEIKQLIASTERDQADLLAFAGAVRQLDGILAREAAGYSLLPLYDRIPAPLRGYVELTYDLQNQPAMRLLEGLLYHSPYYRPQDQAIALSFAAGDTRPAALSTPRLDDPRQLILNAPFASGAIGDLFRSRYEGAHLAALADSLNVADRTAFETLFTTEAPPPAARYTGSGVRIRYFGHACVLVETAEVSLLLDPQIGYPGTAGPDRFSFHDLPESIDYVMFTHNHHDHVLFETLLPIRHKIRNVLVPKSAGTPADPSLKLLLTHTGFPVPYELEEMETIALPGGRLTALPFLGEHGDLNIRSKNAYHIALAGQSFFFGADSDNLQQEMYTHIARVTGPVDALFLGLECDGAPQSWMYGPLAVRKMPRQMDQSRRLCSSDFENCAGMIAAFKAGQVFTYAMGREPWLGYLTTLDYNDESKPIVETRRLAEHCRREGIAVEDLYCRKELFFGASHALHARSQVV